MKNVKKALMAAIGTIVVGLAVLLLLLLSGCGDKGSGSSSSGGGGGGGNSGVTISGTVNVDGASLRIEDESTGEVYYPTQLIVNKSYSAKFSIGGKSFTTALMIFSKSGCYDDAKSIGVYPNSTIDVGGASLSCGI